jgi:hypothetical protein
MKRGASGTMRSLRDRDVGCQMEAGKLSILVAESEMLLVEVQLRPRAALLQRCHCSVFRGCGNRTRP